MPKFIKNKLKSDSDLESDSNLESDELMAKLKDSDYDYNSDSEVESKSNAKLITKLKKFYSKEI